MDCPCGTGKKYADCCEPFHRGEAPLTAEQLMRSRYSAFVLEDAAYILKTWDPRTRPAAITFDEDLEWTGLEVVRTVKGGPEDTMGMVHFRAHYMAKGTPGVQEERSKFLRPEAGGPWVYVG